MAKPTSFNKRENEKKKASKRLEKQKRKEERKSNSTGGDFDSMIAYVDENGILRDTPPDPQEREEIELEDIEIAVPKKTESEEEPLRHGLVEYFNSSKGYGFIKDRENGEKYFFHISAAPATIAEGNAVTFELEKGTRGLNAVNITVI